MKSYKEGLDYIIKKYSKTKNLISIYEWGDVSIPGISDIDVIFVFKKDADDALPFFKRSFYFTNNKIRYLVGHPFIFIDEDSFCNIRYIYQKTDFKLRYGRDIKIKNLNASDIYYTNIALLNDLIIRHYPRDFIEQSINKSINVRDTLLRLHSLKYSIKMLESLTKEKCRSWDSVIKNIKKLRENWFKLKDFGALVSLNDEGVKISIGITEKFREFLLKRKLVKINAWDMVRYNGIKNESLFIRNWDSENALHEMSEIIRTKQKYYSILPIELSAQLIEYSKYKGKISGYIRKNISNNINYKLRHKNIIKQRINILNKQAELASKLKHSDFAAFFDFGYRNSAGINNWILNLLDKIRF